MRCLTCILLVIWLSLTPARALELFGVDLEATNRDELRDAAKAAGLVLIREGGEDNWYDVYDSSSVLEGSSRLYLGFVKQDQRFAFAEYEFHGLRPQRLLGNLTRKYGAAEVRGGQFVSDRSYHWRQGEIRIDLVRDWHNYKTRLMYVSPQNHAALMAERAAGVVQAEAGEEQVSFY